MLIGSNIKRLRKNNKLSQKEFASICGVSNKTVSDWENNKNYPRMNIIRKIANHFGIRESKLFESNNETTNNDVKYNYEFSNEEMSLVNMYRNLDDENKKFIHKLMFHLSYILKTPNVALKYTTAVYPIW